MSLTVSVVMAFNGERYLREALDTVLAEDPFEVVVVDDGSRDGTASVLATYDGVRVLHQENSGQPAALNVAVAAARGDVLCFQDADDLWVPGRQQALIAALVEGVDLVYGAVQQFTDLPPDAAAQLRIDPAPQQAMLLGCLAVRRSSMLAVGPFEESLRSAANIDWLSRARQHGLVAISVPDVVLRRRIHESNLGRTRKDENRLDLVRVMRSHLDRKRSP